MSEIAWFALLLRAIGLFIIVEMTPGLIGYIAYIPSLFSDDVMQISPVMMLPAFATLIGYAVCIAFGAYLLFDGRRVVRFCVRDLVARCAVCGYPLAKITGPVCPECGVAVRKQSPAPEEPRSEQESS